MFSHDSQNHTKGPPDRAPTHRHTIPRAFFMLKVSFSILLKTLAEPGFEFVCLVGVKLLTII